MPCNCDHLEANQLEIELSRVYCLLDELRTGKPVKPDSSAWEGYDRRAYSHADRETADKKTAELCAKLSAMKPAKIKKLSLEMQVWWRDHQEADARKKPNGEGI